MTPPMMMTKCENVNDPRAAAAAKRDIDDDYFPVSTAAVMRISAKHRLMTIINNMNPANSLGIGDTCFCAGNLFEFTVRR